MGQLPSMCNFSFREALLLGLMTDPPQHIWMAVTCTQMIVEKQIRDAMDSIVSVLHVGMHQDLQMETPTKVQCHTVICVTSRVLAGPPLLTWAWPREDRGGPEI